MAEERAGTTAVMRQLLVRLRLLLSNGGVGTATWTTVSGLGGAQTSGLGASSKYHGEDPVVQNTGALSCWLLPQKEGQELQLITESPAL